MGGPEGVIIATQAVHRSIRSSTPFAGVRLRRCKARSARAPSTQVVHVLYRGGAYGPTHTCGEDRPQQTRSSHAPRDERRCGSRPRPHQIMPDVGAQSMLGGWALARHPNGTGACFSHLIGDPIVPTWGRLSPEGWYNLGFCGMQLAPSQILGAPNTQAKIQSTSASKGSASLLVVLSDLSSATAARNRSFASASKPRSSSSRTPYVSESDLSDSDT